VPTGVADQPAEGGARRAPAPDRGVQLAHLGRETRVLTVDQGMAETRDGETHGRDASRTASPEKTLPGQPYGLDAG